MKRLPLLLLLLIATPLAAYAADLAWPDTEPGRHAREYFVAFAKGEGAMREYMSTHADADALRERPVEARVEIYRRMRAEHRELTPISVEGSGPDFVTVQAKNAAGARLEFRFQCAAEAPHGLLGVRVEALEDAGGDGPPPAPEPAASPPTDDQIVSALAAELDSLEKAGEFSGAVLLDKGGKTLFSRAYGLASREPKRANTLETRFNLGSINKIFTTVAIHQLSEAGKLKLDDPIALHLKDYPADNARRITVAMLLEHRSGVPDVFRSPGVWEHPEKLRTAGDWYRAVKDQPLDFEPGARSRYSNGGYCVLGMIVERLSGEDFYDYIRKHVYAPAGMTRTDSYAAGQLPADAAMGYSREPEGPGHGPPGMNVRPGSPWRPVRMAFGRPSAAGGGFSTVGDLVKFTHALAGGKLLSAEGARRVHGGGLGIAGGSPGCNALLDASGPYTLAILANVDPPAAERFAKTIGRMLQRASGGGGGPRQEVRAGGGRR